MYFTTGIFSAKLRFTDTDSLLYEIEAQDVYQDFYKDKDLLNYCSNPQDSFFIILLMKGNIQMGKTARDIILTFLNI